MMTGSTLNPPEESPNGVGIGHSTDALGPSDSSDSGSDVRGAKHLPSDMEDALDAHALDTGADALASDTDRYGTGERASADGDGNLTLDEDVLTDNIDSVAEVADDMDASDLSEADEEGELDVDDALTDVDAHSRVSDRTGRS